MENKPLSAKEFMDKYFPPMEVQERIIEQNKKEGKKEDSPLKKLLPDYKWNK